VVDIGTKSLFEQQTMSMAHYSAHPERHLVERIGWLRGEQDSSNMQASQSRLLSPAH